MNANNDKTHDMTSEEMKVRIRSLESRLDHWKAISDLRWKMILAITGRSSETLEDLLKAQQEGWRWAAECETEVKRLTESIKQANSQAEHYEIRWISQKHLTEQLVKALEEIVERHGAGHSMVWAAATASAALLRHKEQA